MLRYVGATDSGALNVPNEDWATVTPDLVVVLDGATARTETGCRHGAAWYARKLGGAIVAAADNRDHSLSAALANAIRHVARLHPECDLTHPGSPSAGVAIIQFDGSTACYLVLGDVTVVVDVNGETNIITDDRISRTASAERAEANRHAIGTPEKNAAMIRMKHAELAAKNRLGGYWIAGADPDASGHAITGEWRTADVRRLMVMTDGAARAVEFGLTTWPAALASVERDGPDALIRAVRRAEMADPDGTAQPRNKRSDDATLVLVTLA